MASNRGKQGGRKYSQPAGPYFGLKRSRDGYFFIEGQSHQLSLIVLTVLGPLLGAICFVMGYPELVAITLGVFFAAFMPLGLSLMKWTSSFSLRLYADGFSVSPHNMKSRWLWGECGLFTVHRGPYSEYTEFEVVQQNPHEPARKKTKKIASVWRLPAREVSDLLNGFRSAALRRSIG